MIIKVKKFGEILNGRPAGREAALVLNQLLKAIDKNNKVILDFEGVLVLTPSYADEFLRNIKAPAYEAYVKNASPAVKDTLLAIDFPTKKINQP